MSKTKLPKRTAAELETLKSRGRELFFSHCQHNDIAAQLGVSSNTVGDWRRGEGWDVERDNIERGIIEDSFSARKLTLSRITHITTDQLERALKHLANRPEPPTLNEAEKLSVIISNLDKILRLDLGRATDNVVVSQSVHHTVESIRERLAADPVLGSAIAAAGPKELPAPQKPIDAEFSDT